MTEIFARGNTLCERLWNIDKGREAGVEFAIAAVDGPPTPISPDELVELTINDYRSNYWVHRLYDHDPRDVMRDFRTRGAHREDMGRVAPAAEHFLVNHSARAANYSLAWAGLFAIGSAIYLIATKSPFNLENAAAAAGTVMFGLAWGAVYYCGHIATDAITARVLASFHRPGIYTAKTPGCLLPQLELVKSHMPTE